MITYRTSRARAWRNILVAATNAALDQGLFGLAPGDDRWPDEIRDGRRGRFTYKFTLAGLGALGCVGDAGFDELKIAAVIRPTSEAVRRIGAFGGRSLKGGAA